MASGGGPRLRTIRGEVSLLEYRSQGLPEGAEVLMRPKGRRLTAALLCVVGVIPVAAESTSDVSSLSKGVWALIALAVFARAWRLVRQGTWVNSESLVIRAPFRDYQIPKSEIGAVGVLDLQSRSLTSTPDTIAVLTSRAGWVNTHIGTYHSASAMRVGSREDPGSEGMVILWEAMGRPGKRPTGTDIVWAPATTEFRVFTLLCVAFGTMLLAIAGFRVLEFTALGRIVVALYGALLIGWGIWGRVRTRSRDRQESELGS
jgi:hypothetical protein